MRTTRGSPPRTAGDRSLPCASPAWLSSQSYQLKGRPSLTQRHICHAGRAHEASYLGSIDPASCPLSSPSAARLPSSISQQQSQVWSSSGLGKTGQVMDKSAGAKPRLHASIMPMHHHPPQPGCAVMVAPYPVRLPPARTAGALFDNAPWRTYCPMLTRRLGPPLLREESHPCHPFHHHITARCVWLSLIQPRRRGIFAAQADERPLATPPSTRSTRARVP